jgi:hypothetical protein
MNAIIRNIDRKKIPHFFAMFQDANTYYHYLFLNSKKQSYNAKARTCESFFASLREAFSYFSLFFLSFFLSTLFFLTLSCVCCLFYSIIYIFPFFFFSFFFFFPIPITIRKFPIKKRRTLLRSQISHSQAYSKRQKTEITFCLLIIRIDLHFLTPC